MGFNVKDFPEHVQQLIREQDAKNQPAASPSKLAKAVSKDPYDKLNKTERAYAYRLAEMKNRGEILGYHVQAMTFLIGPDCRYTPDFNVLALDGTIINIDTKGTFVREDAVIKLKTAAEKFPWFRWQMIEKRKGKWNIVRDLNKPEGEP